MLNKENPVPDNVLEAALNKYRFSRVSLFFTKDIESLLAFLDQIGAVAEQHDLEADKKMEALLPEMEDVSGQLGTIRNQLDVAKANSNASEVESLEKELKKQSIRLLDVRNEIMQSTAPKTFLLRRGTLVLAVSNFEILLTQLIAIYYHNFPNRLPEEQSIKLSEIRELGSLQEAESFMVDKETETVMRKNTLDQLDYFSKKLNINLEPIEKYKAGVVETTLRRNVIVHNDGFANRMYIKSLPSDYISQNKIMEGEKLPVTQEYVIEAINRFFCVGLFLVQTCWRQWKKDEVALANISIHETVYTMLCRGQYKEVVQVCEFSRQFAGLDDSTKRFVIINAAIAMRELQLPEEVNKILASVDWTACSVNFKVALNVLKNNEKEMRAALDQAIKGETVTLRDIREWPLFMNLRNDAEFTSWLEPRLGKLQAIE